MKQVKLVTIILLLVLLAGFGGYVISEYRPDYVERQRSKAAFEKREQAWKSLEQILANEISQFKGKVGLVIKDLDMNWEISFNKEELFPSASLAKIPIMGASFLASKQGRIKLNRNIALKPADKLSGSGVLKDLPAGTTFNIERLIGLMIYDSDNTATNIVTKLVGTDYLNNSFKAFGLKHTNLSRKIADYQLRDKGVENYTTAEDMAFLLEQIYNRKLGNKDISEWCINFLKLTRMNDRIPKYLPAELAIAHKTGLEKGVCHDAGVVFTKKGDFIICVLTKYANSNSLPSKEFIATTALRVYSYFEDL